MPHPQAGNAPVPVAVVAKSTSAALLLTKPNSVSPPALFHFGNSSSMTVFGASPAFNRLSKVEDSTLAAPTLKVHETSAPYWFALSTTLDVVRRVMVCCGA
jgi:hypothetical protein